MAAFGVPSPEIGHQATDTVPDEFGLDPGRDPAPEDGKRIVVDRLRPRGLVPRRVQKTMQPGSRNR